MIREEIIEMVAEWNRIMILFWSESPESEAFKASMIQKLKPQEEDEVNDT